MATYIGRRKFVSTFCGVVVAAPLAARAQQPTMPEIGFLNGASPQTYALYLARFLEGLKETRYIDGQNELRVFASRSRRKRSVGLTRRPPSLATSDDLWNFHAGPTADAVNVGRQ
jgi:hypothetical protein